MRKKVYGKQLGRDRGSRTALRRSLIRELVQHGGINTTKAKAKAISGEVDKLMRLVSKGSLEARRQVMSKLGNDKVTVSKLFGQYQPLTENRKSGFTRIIALPPRRGDQAEVARIEWVERPKVKKEEKKADKKEKKTTKKGSEKQSKKK